MPADSDLWYRNATDLARMIADRKVSAVEVMEAHLARIEAVNSTVNAIVTLVPDEARRAATEADAAVAREDALGPLHGLPVAHKDLIWTKGIRTTFGSRIFADFVPDADALIVERLRAAGAITIGKTNTPEFGAGSQTFNAVFGATRNPYDPTRTCGGSSGGAAAALAAGMVPLADGSDLGGSLRNPASFCNVVGFRPSPGRVPIWPSQAAWFPMGVQGPMGRTVGDVALMLSAIAGPDARAPLSLPEPGARFRPPIGRGALDGNGNDGEHGVGVRIAWSRRLAGLPFDPRVTAVVDAQRGAFERIGCHVEDAEPDLAGAADVFATWRAWYFELCYGSLLDEHGGLMKETVVWNIEEGCRLSGPQVAAAMRDWTTLLENARRFMERYRFLVLPVAQLPPFDIEQEYPTEIDGVAMNTYVDWMGSCSVISVLGLPAISVPCGFTTDGLPIGVQIVGRQHDDLAVLQLAHAFEQTTRVGERRPAL
ncbi:MAG: amidase [Acidobacteria bacterium]|nr:amidase [Acidobacteriota bacterium]MYJ03259.1 amidase [Acidobacteriota bacterium]